jgi:hypothetical protein
LIYNRATENFVDNLILSENRLVPGGTPSSYNTSLLQHGFLASWIGVEAVIQDFVVLLLYQGNRAVANLLAWLYGLSEILRGAGHLMWAICIRSCIRASPTTPKKIIFKKLSSVSS